MVKKKVLQRTVGEHAFRAATLTAGLREGEGRGLGSANSHTRESQQTDDVPYPKMIPASAMDL